ncbi:MAG: hypothetical protein SGILL_002018 [Bacillariaceae sp.]
MDLGTVRRKLMAKKYQMPEQFARDVRKVRAVEYDTVSAMYTLPANFVLQLLLQIWNNCKIYNRHGSAIWHVADYMAKQFERLYHAWVLDFREKYLRWANPRARPWESSCRQHDGKCDTKEDGLVLCDHCDAPYGYKCLGLKKMPSGVWHCRDCKPKLKSAKGARMLSAVSEQAARKRAELGDTPKRHVNQKMYLVKWVGLGYEYCTWETAEDLGRPDLIAEFHKLNNSFPNEPDMPEETVTKVLTTTEHLNPENVGGSQCIPKLRTQLYAQTRAFEFSKFGIDVPQSVGRECGPVTKTTNETAIAEDDSESKYREEVVECVNELTYAAIVQDSAPSLMVAPKALPPLMVGEYDTVLPVTPFGLMLNVGEMNGSVAFLGYRQGPNGLKGPAETRRLMRNIGDKIIAVNGVSTINKSFQEVIALLKAGGKYSYAYMRFLDYRFATASPTCSSGSQGRYAVEEVKKKFSNDRKRIVVKRAMNALEEDQKREEADEDSAAEVNSDEEDNSSEGSFEPDSDDEAMNEVNNKGSDNDGSDEEDGDEEKPSAANQKDASNPVAADAADMSDEKDEPVESALVVRPETTNSLAFRLLNVDVGYSSDEGGDEECAHFIDGIDETFTSRLELTVNGLPEETKAKEEPTVPVKRNDFSALGDRCKLVASVAVTSKPPDAEYFDENFPYASKKAVEEKQAAAAAAAQEAENQEVTVPSPEKEAKRSHVKVEQISVDSGETVNVWANVESAAATLQLSLNDIKRVLRGELGDEFDDEVGGFRWQYALASAPITAGESKRSKKGKEAWLEFKDKLYDPNDPHMYKNNNRLRDYQVEGVNWLASTFYRKNGCILADEMGLGKTVQIVSYLEHLFRVEKIQGPFLVVVPLSTIEHWRREFEGWSDMVTCVYHDRQRVWRDVLREYEWYYEDKPHNADFLKFHVLVTTYDTLIGDFDVINQIPFRVAVVDEAHRLRNQKGKLLECMKEISAKGTLQHGYQSRVLMSGTPLQNDLTELWTLLSFIEPFKFPDLDRFLEQYGNMANREQVESLQNQISPFMLRRVKEDVAKDIPAKEETVIDVELTSIQKQYYRAIFEHNHAFLNLGGSRQNAPKLMNIQMELRKVCNHPNLLEGVEHREQDRVFKEFLEEGKFEGKTSEEQQQIMNEHLFIQTSGKMVLLDKLLPKLRAEGHKVLVFSQMVRMLDLISDYCEFRSFPYERLDGRVRGTDRQKSIDRFNKEKNSFLFLLSTRAGGVGINLTAADVCIIFDSDWNPQNDVQAQARCHRIGQTKDVRIYRLITSRSFEQEMFDRASKKLGLEQAVLGTFGHDEDDDKPTNKEMEQLLKRGAYALLDDDHDDIVKQFCADDIESILAKRTRTRVVEGAKTASWLNKQGMVVSKSKFTSDSTSANLDMDDPLFWQKVMPDFVTPQLMVQKLQDLSDEIFGITRKRGRGRGRWKKKEEEEKKDETESPSPDATGGPDAGAEKKVENGAKEADETIKLSEEASSAVEGIDDNGDSGKEIKDTDESPEANTEQDETKNSEEDEGVENDEEDDEEEKFHLTKTQKRKINKFLSDVKSMMENVLDDDEDDNLQPADKDAATTLLLTISVKPKIFNEDQRHFAKKMLKRLEGNRRRRCRTTDASAQRSSPGKRGRGTDEIREELRIVSKKKKRRRRSVDDSDDDDGEPSRKRRKRSDAQVDPESGYKYDSDDPANWSDIADEDDIYGKKTTKKATISTKQAKTRRQWAADDDAATAAGRSWPAIPRTEVAKVLGTLLDEVIKDDEAKGGIFSVPVPRDDFPEYYEQISTPMDYGTMKRKLENGEYRSAQAMQKDFILVMQNCLKFNAPDSEIVLEARQQALMRPNLLRSAARSHDLFLAEDGSVLHITDEKVSSGSKRRRRGRDDDSGGGTPKRRKKGKKRHLELGVEDDDEPLSSMKRKKPRHELDDIQEDVAAEDDAEMDAEEEEVDAEPEDEPEPEPAPPVKAKRARKNSAPETSAPAKRATNRSTKKAAESAPEPESKPSGRSARKAKRNANGSAAQKQSQADFLNVMQLKHDREGLVDTRFSSARDLFTKHGPWVLPDPIEPSRFGEIAINAIKKVDKADRYSVFANVVNDDDAPDYSKIVKNPIATATMKAKLEKGEYGEGNDAASKLYADFLLMFDNCRLYNDDDEGDVIEEAARIFSLVPEFYGESCVAALKKQKLVKQK